MPACRTSRISRIRARASFSTRRESGVSPRPRTPLEKRTERERDALTTHFVRNYHFAVGQKRWKELKLDELDKKLRELGIR